MHELIATSAFGIESIVARELKSLGYSEQKVENGRVTFQGDLSAICRSNLWLRTSDRILIKVGEFKALSFEELFEKTKALPWEEWITKDAEFPVEGKSVDSKLFSVPDCQAIVKKAIVEKLKTKYNMEWFPETGPKYKVEVGLLKDVATLTIDTTGSGLHKRGYRPLTAKAPLKETLAAAMILISRWNHERLLIDPFCGSGTIPIEAALIGCNVAPGINRNFVSETWTQLPKKIWMDARKEAHDLAKLDRKLKIRGSDIDSEVLSLARYHLKETGLDNVIHFQQLDMSKISSKDKYGFIICNPPYGERLLSSNDVENLYREMGKVFEKFDTWSYYILTSHPKFETLFGRKADKKRKLYNGRIQCTYFQYFGPPPPKKYD